MLSLHDWENFYVIVGSSAGALIGLQFVVMTLINELPMTSTEAQAGEAFGSPNIVHFSVVLLLSALVSIPWESITPFFVTIAVTGLCGASYTLYIFRRVRQQSVYQPVVEDWFFYVILPLCAYLALLVSIFFGELKAALITVALSSLLLLFIGIHNAWDLVTYHIFVRKQGRARQE